MSEHTRGALTLALGDCQFVISGGGHETATVLARELGDVSTTLTVDHIIACWRAVEEHCGGDPLKVAQMKAALDSIASWEEGPEVTGKFDEPGSAKIARAALSPASETKP